MARPLRIEYDGALYHVTSRGNEQKPIFKDATDRNLFLSTLVHVNQRFHWLCHAYCSTVWRQVFTLDNSGGRHGVRPEY